MITQKNLQAEKLENPTSKKMKYLIDDGYLFVEEFAQKVYQKEGFLSIWAENTYWWEIYALLFWDIIFAKIDGVWSPQFGDFPNEYQDMPQDFFSEDFYTRRESLLKNRMKELVHTDIKEILVNSYKNNLRKRCRAIENWDKFSIDQLCVAIDIIEKDKLLSIMERLFKNFNYNRSGLPDLFVYSEDRYFFVEVKSERDKVSTKQTEWHSFLSDELNINVEIFSVNKKEKGEEKDNRQGKGRIKISFGKSTSKKRGDAISFMEKQETFEKEEKGEDSIYSAYFDIQNIEDLYTILDYTSGWKTQKIELDGKSIHSTLLRNGLWCYKEKIRMGKSLDYCRTNEWDGSVNKFGCKNFYFNQLGEDSWRDYGYVDTQKGEWVFDKDKIKKEIDLQLERLNICPLFKSDKILKFFESMPDRINPKEDTSWSFIDNNFNVWAWKKGDWRTEYSWDNGKFPGYSMMVGVEKHGKRSQKAVQSINIEVQSEAKEKKGLWKKLSDLF